MKEGKKEYMKRIDARTNQSANVQIIEHTQRIYQWMSGLINFWTGKSCGWIS
jgi:hypothetical protein